MKSGAINELHLRYRKDTGCEALTQRTIYTYAGYGAQERHVEDDIPTLEYVQWLEDRVQIYILELEFAKVSEKKIKEFAREWRDSILRATSIISKKEGKSMIDVIKARKLPSGVEMEGKIIKSHMEGDVKAIDNMKITGTVITFNTPDEDGNVILPGAFDESLKEQGIGENPNSNYTNQDKK